MKGSALNGRIEYFDVAKGGLIALLIFHHFFLYCGSVVHLLSFGSVEDLRMANGVSAVFHAGLLFHIRFLFDI